MHFIDDTITRRSGVPLDHLGSRSDDDDILSRYSSNRVVAPAARGDKATLSRLLASAGVGTTGTEPWDLRVHDDRFYRRVLAQGSLGMGDSYVDGWWDCDRIDEMIHRVLSTDIERQVRTDWRATLALLRARVLNLQSPARSPAVAAHYDVGNAFYERLLGRTMLYSCAYWSGARRLTEIEPAEPLTLDHAQDRKLALIAAKLRLAPGERVLDLGCGWGAFTEHAARLGCRVTGVTISPEQAAYGQARVRGVDGAAILRADYRASAVRRLGRFDKIACIGMLEHVGRKNYRAFFEQAASMLADDGLLLLHTIGTSVTTDVTDPWIERRIFPGSVLASNVDLMRSAEGLFVMEDWHNFGADYDRTLMAWRANLDDYAGTTPGGRFLRTWQYYLSSFAGCFRTRRTIQLWQIVLSRRGVRGGYLSVR